MAVAEDLKYNRKESSKEKDDVETTIKILEASGQYTPERLEQLRQVLKDGGPSAISPEIEAAMAALDSSPEGQARKRDIMSERRAQRWSTKFAPLFNAVLAGSDIATSIGQINQAKRGAANLRQPGLPPVPDIDPALNQSIRDAQVGTYDSAAATGQARQVIDDQYQKDIALAKSIGGGQASTLGALGQVASMRRGRAAGSLVPMVDSIRAREQSRLDNLIGQRGGLLDQNYRNKFYQYRAMQDVYDKDAAAVGGLGAAGRQNLRSSVQNLLGATPGVAARLYDGSYGTNFNQGYGDKYSPYEQSLNASLTNTFKPRTNYGSQLAGAGIYNPINRSTDWLQYTPKLNF